MILLALAQTAAILKISSKNTQRTAIIFIGVPPSTTYFPEAKLSSTFLPSTFWKYSKTFPSAPENIQRLFRLQNCLSRKSSAPENIQRPFCLQNCLNRESSAPENIQRLFACKIVLAANHQHPKIFKDFFACKIVLAANHQQYPGNIQRLSSQQPAAAINSSQQQQSTAATSSSN